MKRYSKTCFGNIGMACEKNILLNIILFLPLDFLLGCKKKFIIGFLLSVVIEIVQYTGMLGFCELDDVLSNTVGTEFKYFSGD